MTHLDHMDLTDMFRTSQPKAAEYTFFTSVHGIFTRKDHSIGHNTFKIKII